MVPVRFGGGGEEGGREDGERSREGGRGKV